MSISINSCIINLGTNEISVIGTKAEYTALIVIINDFLNSLEDVRTVNLVKRNNKTYTFSFEALKLVLKNHERLSFEIKNKQICMVGNREAMEMFRDCVIESCLEFDFTDPRDHINWFYYEDHDILNPTDLEFTFSGVME